MKLWDVATHTTITTLEGHRYEINSVSFSLGWGLFLLLGHGMVR